MTHVNVMAIIGSVLKGARHSILTSCWACAPASIVEEIGLGCNLRRITVLRKKTFTCQLLIWLL